MMYEFLFTHFKNITVIIAVFFLIFSWHEEINDESILSHKFVTPLQTIPFYKAKIKENENNLKNSDEMKNDKT